MVFRAPLVLGLLSAIGLVSALLGDGVWDVVSSTAVLSPVAAVIWAWIYRREQV